MYDFINLLPSAFLILLPEGEFFEIILAMFLIFFSSGKGEVQRYPCPRS